jgi:acetoin utilization deacetylase AcuC-like enzyme
VRNKTGLIFFPAFDWAISPTHPEREERLLYTRDQIFEEGVMDLPQIKEYKPRLATLHDIARVHFCVPRVQSQVKEAHLIAAGSALHLGDCVINGDIKNGFALVRPPGHHAMRVVHGNRGFCNINNEAVLVDYLRRRHGVKRVAIVDSDVHHGDGTQDIFFHDPDVLFISFHQDGRTIFPGTGFTHELGGPKAYARTLNIPLAPGCADEIFMYVAEQLVLPVIKDFAPDFIINSAGQDNHFTDPLGSMKFTSRGYAKFTEMLNPHLAVLEGGYAIESALPYVNLAIILALAGIDYGNIREYDFLPGKSPESHERMERVKDMVGQLLEIWANRDQFDVEKSFGDNKFYQRKKSIYYDTDYIEEEQYERLYKCPDCPGYLSFDSSGNYGFAKSTRVFAVSIPFTACSACQMSAYNIYEEAKGNQKFSFVYMQDKSTDTCITFDRAVKQEWTSEG